MLDLELQNMKKIKNLIFFIDPKGLLLVDGDTRKTYFSYDFGSEKINEIIELEIESRLLKEIIESN